jgi:nitrogen-specific signal transduction histidine kinase
VVLTVRDFGPGIGGGRPRGSGLGTRLVSELVARRGGLLECVTGAGGTTVRVALPVRPRRRADPHGMRA